MMLSMGLPEPFAPRNDAADRRAAQGEESDPGEYEVFVMRVGEVDSYGYKYLGNFSATEPWHSRHMLCSDCMASWIGCWDNFQCPQCGEGDQAREMMEAA